MRIRMTFIILTIVFSGTLAFYAAYSQPVVNSNLEKLGMQLYNDKNMSYNGTQSCRNCHHHFAGFADITNHLYPYDNMVSTGADGMSKGGRNAPVSAYAGFSPALTSVDEEWIGGMFWDGRADGSTLGDPLAEQAQGPPLNPIEMAMPSKEAVVDVIRNSSYVSLWRQVFGQGSLDDIDEAYDNFGRAIASYERSADITKFTSKYDTAQLSLAEQRGFAIFRNNCASCHSIALEFGAPNSLFTNYAYANIGVPSNPAIPSNAPDLGLGPVVKELAQNGKFKIPTLRNIAMSAPYSHNGFFPTLKEMLYFINDRSGFTPEVNENLSNEVGNMGLTLEQIDDIEAFLNTLTDDY